ncbi:MAG TPA: hypothetical protein VK983_03955, partial [Candidatus Limnocylindrales bacterium]|nr:hypothetical protein [Candidatus Limnocylindrales bacterium]
SRYTPLMQTSGSVDVGFVSVEDGAYVGIATSQSGELDIFGHDMVLRCPKSSIQTTGLPIARIETIDDQTIGSDLQGALSVGPLVRDSGYDDHPLNADASLGSKPPFSNRPLARTLLFETTDSRVHMQLMDGRPGSAAFSGVTPTEATDIILEENDITWGCFLDPGQTAKLCIQDESGIRSFGNHHYLKWPARSGQSYLWSPQHGRPTASILGVE